MAGARWRSTAAPTPTAAATSINTTPPSRLRATWTVNAQTSAATSPRCTQVRARGATSPTIDSSSHSTIGGTNTTASANHQMSALVALRKMNCPELRPKMSSSGWAIAKPQSANSSTNPRSCGRRPGAAVAGVSAGASAVVSVTSG